MKKTSSVWPSSLKALYVCRFFLHFLPYLPSLNPHWGQTSAFAFIVRKTSLISFSSILNWFASIYFKSRVSLRSRKHVQRAEVAVVFPLPPFVQGSLLSKENQNSPARTCNLPSICACQMSCRPLFITSVSRLCAASHVHASIHVEASAHCEV